MENPLMELSTQGQSVWYDNISRGLITSGALERMIERDGLQGIASNPAIFQKAIAGSADYSEALDALARTAELDASAIYEHLAIADIQAAADLLAPVYARTRGRDGYVSLEVAPRLAHDTAGSIAEARRLFALCARQNVMIKIPGTREGVPAIRALIAEGININVTLLFARQRYEEVALAYLAGIEELLAGGRDLSRVASVASFFLSRIDVAADTRLLAVAGDPLRGDRARALLSKVAVANAKIAYQSWRRLVDSPRWRHLSERGARSQRLLWASTSPKNPSYRDVHYVEALIGPDTVNTMPPSTLDAFRDHGRVRPTLEEDVEGARRTLDELSALEISLDEITDQLLVDAVKIFSDPFDKLIATIEKRRREVRAQEVRRTDAAS